MKTDEGGLRGMKKDMIPSSLYPFIFSSFYPLLLSLGAETTQYLTQAGFFDVDDIVLNVLGGGIGLKCYMRPKT